MIARIALVLAALGATAVALCMNPLRQIILSSVYTLVLAIPLGNRGRLSPLDHRRHPDRRRRPLTLT